MIAEHIAILKLLDGDPKSLGVSRIQSVTSAGLVQGVDYAVDAERGVVWRLHPFGRELLTFRVMYEDGAEERAAREALETQYDGIQADAKARILEAIDGAIADYDAALAVWATLTAAQQKAVLKRLVQVQTQLLRYHRRELL
ncbi:MAG: hypothetical protein WC657_06775 [Candidatus Paceibacterota bacterium]|jgi:hypothetical protein